MLMMGKERLKGEVCVSRITVCKATEHLLKRREDG
jgi:hypothetical protein